MKLTQNIELGTVEKESVTEISTPLCHNTKQHKFKCGQGQHNVDGRHRVKYAIVQFYIKV